jgi:hypothetical protein
MQSPPNMSSAHHLVVEIINRDNHKQSSATMECAFLLVLHCALQIDLLTTVLSLTFLLCKTTALRGDDDVAN